MGEQGDGSWRRAGGRALTRARARSTPVRAPDGLAPRRRRGRPKVSALAGGRRVAKACGAFDLAAMATLDVSLPDDLNGYVEERVATGGYASRGDYVRDLIRLDQEQLQRFRELIQEGLASPVAGPADDAYFETLRERILERSARR